VLSSAPRIVKVTVTPIPSSDPPLLNFLGAHQPYAPGSIVETETSDGVVGIGETYGSRDHPDEEIAAVHALVPARLHDQPARTTSPPARTVRPDAVMPRPRRRRGHVAQEPRLDAATAPAVVTPAGQNTTHEGEQ
jgi:L-alanine-DL-glutamate epimerase-like enolase superfamily enzyme